jgi:hypothetical protein
MQTMNWTMARLGSRFSLTFEPYHRRVLHSTLGRFLDQPLDLMVGLEEPDGTRRVLPFTQQGKPLYGPEQFERLNSITFRGHSEACRLRFEFNVHSVFFPQDERLCLSPVFYLEMRVNPAKQVRWIPPKTDSVPTHVKLFIRLSRPQTQITASAQDNGRIDLSYRNTLAPVNEGLALCPWAVTDRSVAVSERIVSLNPGAVPDADGQGLVLELPVTEIGSGVKWRLVWAAYCGEPVLKVKSAGQVHDAPLHYVSHFKSLDDVVRDAVAHRDDRLLLSRNFEKVFEQAPLRQSQRHLLSQGFQSFLSNTFWCDLPGGKPWFSVWEGSCFFHSTIDVEYNNAMLYLLLWPQLLEWQLQQWSEHFSEHAGSGGVYLHHDMGGGVNATGQAYNHPMPVEENCNYLLLFQAYVHWTANIDLPRAHGDLLARLAKYLLWTDRDGSGFPSEGTANTIDDAGPAAQYSRKQTYLAVKRAAGLRAAADLLARCGQDELAARCEKAVDKAVPQIESQAWLGDHYAVCIDRSTQGLRDVWTGQPLPYDQIPGWDGYSIYTGNGVLLPMMIAQPPLLDIARLVRDLRAAFRETIGPYGCGHTSADADNVWVSQNLWRDHLARYLGLVWQDHSTHYWDMQIAANTGDQSCGFIDTYVYNNLSFYPRGATAMGYLMAGPRLVLDRLAAGGSRISVEPDRNFPQRWPLLPLADWRAGKIPVCVVDPDGNVLIENEMDPVIVRGGDDDGDTIG